MDKNIVSNEINSNKLLPNQENLMEDRKKQHSGITNTRLFLTNFMQILETTPATVLKEPVVGKEFVLTEETLNKELEKIEERTKYFIKEKKQMEELYQFMNEAKQKIEIADSFKDKEDVRDAGGT